MIVAICEKNIYTEIFLRYNENKHNILNTFLNFYSNSLNMIALFPFSFILMIYA